MTITDRFPTGSPTGSPGPRGPEWFPVPHPYGNRNHSDRFPKRFPNTGTTHRHHHPERHTMTTVLGIDPSLTGTGLAHPDGTLTTVASKPTGKTIDDRHDRMLDIVGDVLPTYPVMLVVIEAPSLGQARQGGTLDRMGLWWLIIHELRLSNTPVIDVPPATLKKFATGKGNATKPDMRMALFQRAGIDCRDDNQVDAWWLAELGRHLLSEPTVQLPKAHTDALAKLPPIDTAPVGAPVEGAAS